MSKIVRCLYVQTLYYKNKIRALTLGACWIYSLNDPKDGVSYIEIKEFLKR